ncbi:predicted protein [Histoplasma capsulatum G186AR]|uniref:Uncharacterized protein n=1 Tax=Ajellomyces capsulatus (strain G186AR / H82 / ATCC MYA-2454 / RMSCC 2432) TaxID=447093 RepID=C0NF28_AJECG|nr:uncharacterized protein HCBG_01494 [Histoplasma capsulatum G186AR]EEH09849.1 predicted protein [Histoplasma capsulatum G186AR]
MEAVVHDKSPERGPQAFEHRSHSPSFHSERPKSSVAKGTTPFLIWRMSSSNSKIAWLSSTHGSTPGHMVSSSNRLLSQFSTRRQSAMTGIRQYIDGGIWSCSSSIIQEAQDVVGTKMLQSGIRHLIETHTCKSTSTLHDRTVSSFINHAAWVDYVSVSLRGALLQQFMPPCSLSNMHTSGMSPSTVIHVRPQVLAMGAFLDNRVLVTFLENSKNMSPSR